MSMRYRIGIVASRFNQKYVDGLLESALPLLEGHDVEVVRVPGAFEIPLAVQKLLARGCTHAVIALGVIWRGETDHASLIAETVTNALMRIMLDTGIPVIHQVVTVKTEKEAEERCFGDTELNRGKQAALGTLELLEEEIYHG